MLCEAFCVGEAHRLVNWFEWHYTLKHGRWLGSWLDMTEIEMGLCVVRCLGCNWRYGEF